MTDVALLLAVAAFFAVAFAAVAACDRIVSPDPNDPAPVDVGERGRE
jgi:hypothetical protein